MRLIIILFLLSAITSTAYSQKVKYKDLYVLLNAQRYDEAEPFLRAFLAEEKNKDHANAQLHMGNIFIQKSAKADILSSGEESINSLDSAIYYYNQAIKYIDEKEIKKNEEFYESYIRRDLRTGKVGVKLSDIHFDLQKRIEALQEKIHVIEAVKDHYEHFSSFYLESEDAFRKIRESYPEEKILVLRANEETIGALRRIQFNYDSAKSRFFSYKKILSENPGLGYDQVWKDEHLNEYNAPLQTIDFKGKINTYNLSDWADKTVASINEIQPLKRNLIDYDAALNELYEKMMTDSVSAKTEISKLEKNTLSHQLEKIDSLALPIAISQFKWAELNYLSNLLSYKVLEDSSDVLFHIGNLEMISEDLNKMDSLINILIGIDIIEESLNYQEFVTNRFGSGEKLMQYAKAKLDMTHKKSREVKKALEEFILASNYMVYEGDSIPLFYDSLQHNLLYSYIPKEIVAEEYTVGLVIPEGKVTEGFFTDINTSRKSKVKVEITLDTTKYKNEKEIDVIAMEDSISNSYYLLFFNTTPVDTINNIHYANLASINKAEGLMWNKEISLPQIPDSIKVEEKTIGIFFQGEAIKPLYLDHEGKLVDN